MDARHDDREPLWGPPVPLAAALLERISRAQRDFILDGDAREVLGRLLDDVLAITSSEYGFIGEVETGPDGAAMLRTWAITNIAWTDELTEWFEQNSPLGIEFTNLETLFGAVVTSGEAVVANEPATDPRRGGLPDGHPPLDAFLGLPFRRGDELLGMVGLANRPGGYGEELIEQLQPFLTTCSAMIEALRSRRDREVAEARLRLSEARTRAILESVPDSVVVIDEQGRIEAFNHAAELTFLHAAEEVIGRNVSMLMTPEDARVYEQFLCSHPTGAPPEFIGTRRDVVGRRRDGTTFPFELTVAEVPTEHGRLYAATCRDVTERNKAEREIRMYAGTIEATTDFVGVATPAGEVLAINRAGRMMTGLPLEGDIRDIDVGDIHAPWSRELVRTVGLPTAIRKGSWAGETAFIGPGGDEIPMSQVIVVSKDAEGEAQLVSTIARDISETKEIERVKSEFVSTVSHELRTPLTSVRGSLALLVGGALGELPPKAAELAELAHNNAERLIRLVNDILDFERAAVGKLEIHFSAIDPLEVARAAVDAVRGMATEADVGVVVADPIDAMPSMHGDEARVVQVLVNLIGNGVKFSDPGGQVSVAVSTTADGSIEFRVSDHGTGIAETQLESIFEPFHQVDSSDRRSEGGTGLGLAIARSITEAHRGSIAVESTIGVGSTFRVTFPAAQTSGASAPVPSLPASPAVPKPPADRPDVLLGGHDATTRVVLRGLLESRRLSCAEAVSGDDTVRQVALLCPRVLLLDERPPFLDGYDVVERLRAAGRGDLALVVYTHHDLTEADRARLTLGPTRHLVKSRVGDEVLVDTLVAMLDVAASTSS